MSSRQLGSGELVNSTELPDQRTKRYGPHETINGLYEKVIERHAKPQHGGRSRADGIICHGCYEKEHIQPDCRITLKELWKVVKSYEALTDAEKARVPPVSYFHAKAQFTTDGRIVTPGVPTSQGPTPYPRTSEPRPRVLLRRDTTDHSSKN